MVNRDSKVHNFASSLFCWLYLSLVVWSRLGDPFVYQNPREVCLILQNRCWVVHISFVWTNVNFLHNSQWIILPTQSCLVLHSFDTNLLPSLMSLIVSFLLPQNLLLLFCCVIYFCFDMIGSYRVVLCFSYGRFNFSLKVSLSLICPCFLMFAYKSFKTSVDFFFFFRFSYLVIVVLLVLVLSVLFLAAVISLPPRFCM